jgi:hypothetical protein
LWKLQTLRKSYSTKSVLVIESQNLLPFSSCLACMSKQFQGLFQMQFLSSLYLLSIASNNLENSIFSHFTFNRVSLNNFNIILAEFRVL